MPVRDRRVLVSGILAWAALGPARAASAIGVRPLVLEEFFKGRLAAEGRFTNTRDGTVRGLKVAMHGGWDGRTLTLVEDFVYSDGERDRKTWRFTRLGEGRYAATREDVIGEAQAFQDGPALRLRYTARVKTPEGTSYDLRFNDTLTQTGPRTVLNTADVSFLFFPVGKVELNIRRL